MVPKYTLLFELKFVPYIVTEVPTGPEVGEREEMVGVETVAEGAVTVKEELLLPLSLPSASIILKL